MWKFSGIVGLVLLSGTSGARAECVQMLACENTHRPYALCAEGEQIRFTYGREGASNMVRLSRNVTLVDLMPWPGEGGSIWERVTLVDGEVEYVLWYDITRDDAAKLTGGLKVYRDGEAKTSVECSADHFRFSGHPLPIRGLKEAAGQRWDADRLEWVRD